MRTSRKAATLMAAAATPRMKNVIGSGRPVLTGPAIVTADDVPQPDEHTTRGTRCPSRAPPRTPGAPAPAPPLPGGAVGGSGILGQPGRA
ncbi:MULTISPECIES: hypothetical protein [unclassified Streptomyces]|uniref:hypothetical protein n=1 Tax=unclassified Streptomyces TaxID=2593676 RepID=UPI002B1D054E|nr:MULTISPECIES: hypothetical protein [unclassified Streptomyces]